MKKICFFIIFLVLIILSFYKFNETFKTNNTFNDNFDKIIYINLEHRKDRKEQLLNEFKKMNIDEKKIYRLEAVHSKYNGHIGCAKSHIKALNYAKQKKFKRILVFEDDFIFTLNKNEVQNKLDKFLKEYEGNWDVVQLTSHYKTFRNNDENNDIRLINKASTSSSYMINSNFYDNLLKNLNSAVENMEKEMVEYNKKNNFILKKKKTTKYALDQHWYSLQKKSKWFLFDPYLGKQGGDAGNSSIMSNNLEGFVANNTRLFSLLI
jgi:GR25 family glycosyltransferase involved in LPS biosynthesis